MAEQAIVPNRTVDQFLMQLGQQLTKAGVGRRSVFGFNYTNAFAEDQAYRAKFYPQPGEDFESWARRLDKELPGAAGLMGVSGSTDHFEAGTKFLSAMTQDEAFRKQAGIGFDQETLQRLRQDAQFADPNRLGESEQLASAPRGPSGADLMAAFAREMMAPLDTNDPYVQQVLRAAQGAASDEARMRGINGGYAVSNVENAALRAGNDIQMQRNQLGLQALGAAENIGMQQAQMAQQQYNQAYQAQLAQLQNAYQNQANTGRLIGGAVGTAAGLVGSYFAPAMAPALVSGGAQLGAGIGGGIAGGGGMPYLPYNPPSSGSRYGSY